MNGYKLLPAMLAVVAILLVAACTGIPSNVANAPTDVNKPPIRLGSIASCSGAQAASLGGVCDMLVAWERYINARGGINGHPVKMTVIDDGLDPARSLAGIKRLVEDEKVIALVGEYSLLDVNWADYVQTMGVPVIGGTSTEPPFATQPGFYPSGAQVPTLLYGLVNETKKAGKRNLGVLVCAEAPVCAGLPPVLTRIATQVIGGSSVAYSGKIAASQPNYTAECLAAKEAGVDALYVAQNSVVVERVADQCGQQGFHPVMLGTVGTLDRNAPNPNFEGALSALPNASITIASTPATKAFHDALSTYAGSLVGSPQYNNALTSAWAGGELFAAAAAKGNLGPDSTAADVKNALYMLKDETLGGYAAPLTFARDKPTLVHCYFVQRIDSGKLDALYGGDPVCIPEAEVPALMAAVAG
jgi:branched-chain amino acid transport system substrate-binding protein